uniref:Uncharacterized protein n=1 Tax=Clastoptera arizonana TaxID=38151 RepID=A0A1B6BWP2_9HEMI
MVLPFLLSLVSFIVLSSNGLFVRSAPTHKPEGPMVKLIREKLTKEFQPIYLSVINKSVDGSEDYVQVKICCEKFRGLTSQARRDLVYPVIEPALDADVKIIQISTRDPEYFDPETFNPPTEPTYI